MPQMAPISWLTLFFIFSATLITFSIMNYFMISPEAPESSEKSIKSPSLNWKW
uniref:ATP synthase complex subunit 8 n=2 Tax=Apteranabropsis TaxID=1945548 RepID=A0A9E8D051_9ORTH|nr:ATP synthase F0 subunit 8 [Anabropsis guangxiensis]YP_010570218.1 ATP synthase F0 subunit 8 [Anabropsis shii]UZF98262.1 ATP synthase F0 subunit 8 [Anabropsis guangxiensis]UZF98275.1 ATP synthase F0 subunit 8 [Anabropsis shii]